MKSLCKACSMVIEMHNENDNMYALIQRNVIKKRLNYGRKEVMNCARSAHPGLRAESTECRGSMW